MQQLRPTDPKVALVGSLASWVIELGEEAAALTKAGRYGA